MGFGSMRLGLKKNVVATSEEILVIPSLGNGVSKPITPEDAEQLLESVRALQLPAAGSEFHVDWMGIRTRIGMLQWAPSELAGITSEALPIPDDSYRSETSEYVALALALDRAIETLCIVEVGAGWAPWVVAGLATAKRRGLQGRGLAIEADLRRASWAVIHAQDNGIDAELIEGTPTEIIDALRSTTTEMQIIHAAGWMENTFVNFPDVSSDDMGVAVCTLGTTGTDYRGAHLPHVEIPAIALSQVFSALNMRIDLLHVDVQGIEFELISQNAGTIQSHAVTMAIGTHSRKSEGQLQQFFLERGWGLRIDEPCKSIFTMTHPTLEGFTVQDGFHLYENPFLLDQIKS
jgi:hypothetical protein